MQRSHRAVVRELLYAHASCTHHGSYKWTSKCTPENKLLLLTGMSDCQSPADGSVIVVRLSDLKQPQVHHTQSAKASHSVEQTLHAATAERLHNMLHGRSL
jgi:hypothetical protein